MEGKTIWEIFPAEGLYREHGLTLKDIREPLHPNTGKPASVIFVGTVDD